LNTQTAQSVDSNELSEVIGTPKPINRINNRQRFSRDKSSDGNKTHINT